MEEKKKLAFLSFMEQENVFDRVKRETVWQLLEIYQVGGKVLADMKGFYAQNNASVGWLGM